MEDFLADIESFVWGPALLVPLLVGTGLYLTLLLRGLQFRRLWHALWLALVKRKEEGAEGDVTHYQALSTALAATVGVGNIAGVATAIHLGGPGALFWMWITGLVGMATKYSEAFLGVKFRRVDANGQQSGGPMFYLSEGIRNTLGKVLAWFFVIAAAIAAFGIGNMTQSNSVADELNNQLDLSYWVTGIVIAFLAGLVLIGGIKRIAAVAAGLVPIMVVIYILGALLVLILNVDDLPGAVGIVFADAFTGTAATGGFVGVGILAAIRYGVERGMFSNESGLGTGGIAAAAAKTTHPVRQAMVSMTQTFIDTLVVVSFTGLVIITTAEWETGETGAPLTSNAFEAGLPGDWGGWIVTIGIVTFAFSTLLGWSYYGERCMDRMFGVSAIMPYRALFVVVIVIGAVTELETVWSFSAIMNGLMALPNLIGLLILSPFIYRESKAYFARPDWEKFEAVKPGTD